MNRLSTSTVVPTAPLDAAQILNPKQPAFGEITLAFTSNFEKRWRDSGTGANRDVTFFHPIPPEGFFPLGSMGIGSHAGADGREAAICVKATDPNSANPPLKFPDRYMKLWDTDGTGADRNGSCWRPIPPSGYVALGDVFVDGKAEPASGDVMCVRADLTERAQVGFKFWSTDGSGADDFFAPYHLETISTPYVNEANPTEGLIAPNCFVGGKGHSSPIGEPVNHVLKLPFPAEKMPEPPPPVLKDRNLPMDTASTIDHVVWVPFTAIKDDTQTLSEKVAKSPFYKIVRKVNYKVELFRDNATSVPQNVVQAYKTGISNTKSKSFTQTVGVSITTEAGISAGPAGGFTGSVSATLSVQLGYSRSTSITEFTEKTILDRLSLPANSALALWVANYDFEVQRGDGTTLNSDLSYSVDNRVISSFPRGKTVSKVGRRIAISNS